jgi:hypothetical protein
MDTPGRQNWIKGLKRRTLRCVTEYQKLDLVEGSTPSEAEKESVGVRRAGYGGAPATQGVFVPIGETEKKSEREKKQKKTLDDGDTTGPPGTLTVNRSGRAVLKEGADVAVGKWKTRKT